MLFLKYFNEHLAFPIRFRILANKINPYLVGCRRVLDYGCSCGRLSQMLSTYNSRLKFVGADVVLQPQCAIPVTKIVGNHVNHPSHFFDCVMLIDVLHHTKRLGQVIQESKRLTKKYLLIKDHYYTSVLDLILLRINDYLGNQPYGISLPYAYLRLDQWYALFNHHHLKILSQETYHTSVKHVIFLIQLDHSK